MRGRRRNASKALKSISEQPIVFGRMIAKREYRVGTRRISVQLGTPHRVSGSTDWYCPFRIISGRDQKIRRVFGVDALQSLMLVFDLIRSSTEMLSPKIEWDGSERPGDVGICQRIPTGLGSEFDKYLEQLVNDSYRAGARQVTRSEVIRAGVQGGLLLPRAECRKFRGLLAVEDVVLEERENEMVFARFPTGTRVWSCPQVNLPSGTQLIVAVGVTPGSGGKGRSIVVLPGGMARSKVARSAGKTRRSTRRRG